MQSDKNLPRTYIKSTNSNHLNIHVNTETKKDKILNRKSQKLYKEYYKTFLKNKKKKTQANRKIAFAVEVVVVL